VTQRVRPDESRDASCALRFELAGEVEVDCIGIGFGPANIAVAVALEEMGFRGEVLFLERATAPDWQSEMLLEGSDIQHNPLRDFATPRNPKTDYGFLNYLKSQDRLWDYFNLGAEFPPRAEYARYVRWVARHFDHQAAYGERVEHLEPMLRADGVPLVRVTTSTGRVVRARAVLFAPGRSPHVPSAFAPLLGDNVVHFTSYLTATSRWAQQGRLGRVAVVGASQSAVEIVLDLVGRFPQVRVDNIFRGVGYQLKDTSPFTEHIYFPEFVDQFHAADLSTQQQLTRELWRSNYGSADSDVIHQLYLKQYCQRVSGQQRIVLHAHRDLTSVQALESGKVKIELRDRFAGGQAGGQDCVIVDAVVLATGFRNFGRGAEQEICHPLLQSVYPAARKRADGTLQVTRNYHLEADDGAQPLAPIFLNGVCESTHGFGDAGSFSLLSIRSWAIASAMVKALASESVTTAGRAAVAGAR
jgi:L-ornithine N5-monooxygenase